MKTKQNNIDRRNFLKTMGAAGLGSALVGCKGKAENQQKPTEPEASKASQEQKYPQIPRRKLGKTGVKVPCLSFGTLRVDTENQILLRKTLQWSVNYWDTAYSYSGGNAELGIGKFLSKNPDVRKKLFLVTKASGARNEPTPKAVVAAVEERLQTSLKRLNTKHIDLYYGVHGMSDPAQLTDELKQWAKDAKKKGLIRFFGFTTHQNMTKCLAVAAKLDWIDAIMTSYNFRLMQDKELNASIEACHKAGIGLVAMKTLGRRQKIESEEDKKLTKHFLERGFTPEQAMIKVVLEDKRFSSACVGTPNVAILTQNVAAVLDKTKLTQADMKVFKEYTRATCSGYCAGCAHICESVLPNMPYVSDIMRYLMYYNSYGEKEMARELFAEIPNKVKDKLLSTDYSSAETRCPQHIPIGELVAEAVSKLA